MLRLVVILAVWVLAYPSIVLAQPYPCPRADSCHGLGTMAMSPDGAFVAFTLMSSPATQFVLFDTGARRAIIVRAPAGHSDLGDLAWSPDGDELTFVTGAASVLGGYGSSVWRLRPRDESPLVLLANIPHVRHPVLSSNGTTLAAFEGVILGDPPYSPSSMAYALFERATTDGRAVRRSEGHVSFARDIFYDRVGALYIGGMLDPVFIRTLPNAEVSYYWADNDERNRWSWQWRREIRDVFSFRLAPGELLPNWPIPFPASGALEGAHGMRPTNDGRVITHVSLSNENVTDWYDTRGMPRRPTRELLYGYMAYDAEGVGELFETPALPEGAGRTGGADISEDGSRFAQVISRHLRRGARPANEAWDNRDTLEIYDRGVLVFEARVSALTTNAPSIQPTDPHVPLMPTSSTGPHRVMPR
jgi:hypothetical protein